jgi:hypothetical protein
MDTNLGHISLTQNQINRLITLNGGNIKGFCYHGDTQELVVTTDTKPDVTAVLALVNALPNTPIVVFDPNAIMTGVFNIFQNNLVIMGPYAGTLQLLMQFQNWAGLSALRNQLVSANIITQDEANQLTALFADQGVILP